MSHAQIWASVTLVGHDTTFSKRLEIDQAADSVLRRWNSTCLLVSWEEDLHAMADVSMQGDGKLSVADYEAATREMQDVLSRRLPVFYRIAYRLLGNPEDAEDAVQDALLAAHEKLQQFRGESQMATWLTAIVFNSARMQLRKRARVQLISLDHPVSEEHESSLSGFLEHPGPTPEDEYRNSEADRYLTRLTTQLSPLLRRTFWLRTMEELSIRETSLILGLSCEAVKAHLFRARAKLKRIMNKRRP